MSESLRRILCMALATAALGVVACAPEIGSEAWCRNMDEKPKGDWTANEAADYARSCLFSSN
jgi:hypothetical protein